MSHLTAIDVLIEPDTKLVLCAKAANARLRLDYPGGFALDESHVPHMTLLQRYVRTNDLPEMFRTVDLVLRGAAAAGLELEATGFSYVPLGDFGIMGIDVTRTPALEHLHAALIDAVAPFSEGGGTAAAFVTTPEAPTIIAPTIQYVHDFVPKFSGRNYRPHVTVGQAHEALLERMKQEPFARLVSRVSRFAVYQLGEFGTAQKKLWAQ